MQDSFGTSFLPGQQSNQPRDPGAGTPDAGIQSAVRILSLRLPRITGGGSPAPAPLLQGAGAMGSPYGHPGVLQTQQQGGGQMHPLLQALLQMSGMGGSAPMQPHVDFNVLPGDHAANIPSPIQSPSPLAAAGGGWNANPYHSNFMPSQPDQPLADFGPNASPAGAGWGDQAQRPWLNTILNR